MKQCCNKHPGVSIEYDFDISSSGYMECPLCLAQGTKKEDESKEYLELLRVYSSLKNTNYELSRQVKMLESKLTILSSSTDSFLERVRNLGGFVSE